MNFALLYQIDANQFHFTRTLWKRSGDVFVINDNIAHCDAFDQVCMKVWLLETRFSARSERVMPFRK